MASTSPIPAPTPSTPKPSKTAVVFGILKYALPVVASVLSIWLHNKQSAQKIQTTVDAVSSALADTAA